MTGRLSGAVLAGGGNSRFPKLKGFIEIEGSTIIGRNISMLKKIFGDVMISTNMPGAYFALGEKMIGDVLPSRGPMSGIHACLLNAGGDGVFIMACDMPFVKRELVELICDERRKTGASAVAPLWEGRPEPLLGIYGKELIPHIETAVLNGKTSLTDFLRDMDAYFIPDRLVREKDATGRSFVNINTVEDFEKNTGVSFSPDS